MGWERRGNRQYYYRKERDGKRVKSVYVGCGEVAHLVSEIQSRSLLIERFAATTKSADQVKFEKCDKVLYEAIGMIDLVTDAVLLAGGFHTHHRQWRRGRNGNHN